MNARRISDNIDGKVGSSNNNTTAALDDDDDDDEEQRKNNSFTVPLSLAMLLLWCVFIAIVLLENEILLPKRIAHVSVRFITIFFAALPIRSSRIIIISRVYLV